MPLLSAPPALFHRQRQNKENALHSFPRRALAKKKNWKGFRAVTAVKELARTRIGMPPSEQVAPDKKKKRKASEKHKTTLARLLSEEGC